MRLNVLRTVEELVAVAPAWRELAAATDGRFVTLPLWCIPWWTELGRGRLGVVTVHDGGELVALAPFHERRLAGLRVTRFLGHGTGAVSELLVRPGQEAAAELVWARLLGDGPRLLELLEYRAGGGGLAELRASYPDTTRVRPSDVCAVAPVEGSFDAYLLGRGKGLRRSLRRADERLAEEGLDHEVEVVTDGARLTEVLPELVAVHDRAEEAKPRQHLLRGRMAPFTTAMFTAAAEAGQLRLFVGRIDGRAVAFDAAVRNGPRLEVWLGRIDPEYKRFSPGHLSCRAIVRHAHESSLREVDLGLGDDRYKRLWCDGSYGTRNVLVGSSRGALRFGTGVLDGARRLRSARGAAAGRRHGGAGATGADRPAPAATTASHPTT